MVLQVVLQVVHLRSAYSRDYASLGPQCGREEARQILLVAVDSHCCPARYHFLEPAQVQQLFLVGSRPNLLDPDRPVIGVAVAAPPQQPPPILAVPNSWTTTDQSASTGPTPD